MNGLEELLRNHLADAQSGWSMGSFGALAEFLQDDGETAIVDDRSELKRSTQRGAIHLDLAGQDELAAVAYEILSPKRHRWSQAVALCLPESASHRAQRAVLTEIGPDEQAIREEDRAAILFDMGLALKQCDFCIRTDDPALLAELRRAAGRSMFEEDNDILGIILKAHPHRVALTNVGRIEVFQKIGGPDTGGVSPSGPHTHVLPKLLASGRTHSANAPIPPGMVPLAYLHPGNPVMGPMGEERAFDGELHDAFEDLLEKFGRPAILAARQIVTQGIDEGREPDGISIPHGRFERNAVRLAIRQQRVLAAANADADRLALAARWSDAFDPGTSPADEDDEAPGH